MFEFILALLTSVRVFFHSRSETALEIIALRQQIVVLKRKRPRPRLNQFDRLFWIILRCVWSRWTEVLVAVKPETVVGWHRAGFRLFWKWQSRAPAGRPKTTAEIRAPHPPPGRRECDLGSAQDPWRTPETGLCHLRANRRPVSATGWAPR